MTLAFVIAVAILPLVAGAAYLFARRDAAAPLRADYRTYDLRRLREWGYDGRWLAPGEAARIIGPTPRVGDVVIGDAAEVYVISDVDRAVTPAGTPTDQCVVTVAAWRRRRNLAWRLPDRTAPTGDDLL